LVVTGVVAACIATGAVAGIGCGVLLQIFYGGFRLSHLRHLPDLQSLAYGAELGATCGLVLGPLAILGFMRRVPLGRLFAEMCLGTIVMGTIGLLMPIGMNGSLAIAAIGFLGAGARLAWQYRRKQPLDRFPPLANTR
jgi:hypothetical protein